MDNPVLNKWVGEGGGGLLKITYIKIIREGGLKAHPRLTKLEVIVGVKLA